MLNATILETNQARFDAAAATEKLLRRHGAGLCNLLGTLDDENAFAAFCDLHCAFDQPVPDADRVEAKLRDIHHVLSDQLPSSLERIGQRRNLPVSEMILWYGARLSELLARFRHAC